MFRNKTILGSGIAILALTTIAALAAYLGDEDFDLSWNTIDGGGAMQTTGGDFELSATIGQPDAGAMTGGDFEMTAGFWFPVVAGDCNADGTVNLVDYESFLACITGPDGGLVSPDCACFDFTDDDDVDLIDFAIFQVSFAGVIE